MALSLAAATLGGSLLSSAFGLFGAKKQNKAAQQEASTNREFQQRMSNTAYQRAANDLQKAGLNRILAVKQGGATSPSGAVAPVVNELAETANSARAVASQMATIKNIETQTVKTQSEADLAAEVLDRFRNYGDSVLGRQAHSAAAMAGTIKKKINKSHISGQTLRPPRKSPKMQNKTSKPWAHPDNVKFRRQKFSDWWNQK